MLDTLSGGMLGTGISEVRIILHNAKLRADM